MGPPFKIENMWTIQVGSCASCGELLSSTQAWQWNKIDRFIDDFATQTFILHGVPITMFDYRRVSDVNVKQVPQYSGPSLNGQTGIRKQ